MMPEQTVTKPVETDGHAIGSKAVKRRGLLAAAWAAVAGVVLTETTQPVEAAAFPVQWSNDPNETVANAVSSPVQLSVGPNLGNSPYGNVLLNVDAVSGAPPPFSSGGIRASTVFGIGVLARSTNSAAVYGETPGGTGAVASTWGSNQSLYTGVRPGAGGFGVYGQSLKGHGVVGATGTAGGAGVAGSTNGVSGAYAGLFFGPVFVTGDFTVVGAKSAAVPHPDGSHRLLYCVESPESWLEDFGKGTLVCGQAEVTLDPNFAAVADTEEYHVFVTQYDEHNDLCVTRRTAAGFLVKAKNSASSSAFSWRVVAKRKDICGERLAKITMPSEPVFPPPPSVRERSEPRLG